MTTKMGHCLVRKNNFVNQANDKITKNIEYLMSDKSHKNIVLFSDILDKKSTLRNLFEKIKQQ